MLKVEWETDDVVVRIMALQPALCDLVSTSKEHLNLVVRTRTRSDNEAIASRITSFLLAHNHCSVLVATLAEQDPYRKLEMFHGFWVSSDRAGDKIFLRYEEIPQECIERNIRCPSS